MKDANILANLTDRCDIYFEGELISKELIIEKYFDFFISSLSSEGCTVNIALHTGSMCFDIISLFMATLGGLSLDMTTPEQIISSLNIGDMVMFENERYRWCGIEYLDDRKSIKLEQDGRGKNGKSTRWVPYDCNKNFVKPYYGTSLLTDGRGIRKVKSNRRDFIAELFDVSPSEVPSVSNISTVIVTERHLFDRIARGMEIVYGKNKRVGLLDVATAAYYTDREEYQFGNNPAKTEPILKVTGKVSIARDLVLNKHGNKVVGLMIIGSDSIAKGNSELVDLLGRKALCFSHVSATIDSEIVQNIVNNNSDANLFACTKEFLLQNSLPPRRINPLTEELDRQIANVMDSTIETITVDGGCTWKDLRKIKESLHIIKQSEWSSEKKKDFILSAYSLLNLFTTAIFSMQELEKAINKEKLNVGVISPALRIRNLWEWAEAAGTMEYTCAFVADVLEQFYKKLLKECPKQGVLSKRLLTHSNRKIAVVVPKAYYIDILAKDDLINNPNVTVITANRFDGTNEYDEIIVVGDFSGKRFNPLKCKATKNIVVLLYDCEMHLFRYKTQQMVTYEEKINARMGISIDETLLEKTNASIEHEESEELAAVVDDFSELDQYIDNISVFDIEKFATKISGLNRNLPLTDVCTIGRFVSGEQILFSKYYNPLVFDSRQGTVIESDTNRLSSGDILVFAKRDDYTQNMVDYIYENLQMAGRLSTDILEATEKAFYWKEALREYKSVNKLSYRDIAKELRKLGSALQEMAVRQWLMEESHIIGPRDAKTMEQIAELTGDPYLINDPHAYHNACRLVRKQRKKILGLIGEAIKDKLSGQMPPSGSELELVYENVESLSETLELESLCQLDEPITAPVSIVNKPIIEAEDLYEA